MMLVMTVFVLLDYVQLVTSLLTIFYSTAKFPRQMRLQLPKDQQISIFSMATLALITWRTFIVGSRIMIFVMFALVFQSWLFVFIGFHYLLTLALVFYQMRLTGFPLITKIVYNLITPLAYVFDFCLNWLEGPSRYWYLICCLPMYCENVVMSALILWNVSTMASPVWLVPGCVCVILMFPTGVLVQLTYYHYLHPNVKKQLTRGGQTTRYSHRMTWSEFLHKVEEANPKELKTTRPSLIRSM